MTKKVTCDRCGEEIDDGSRYKIFFEGGDIWRHHFDVCEKCAMAFKDFMEDSSKECEHYWVEVVDQSVPPMHSCYRVCKKCGKEDRDMSVKC